MIGSNIPAFLGSAGISVHVDYKHVEALLIKYPEAATAACIAALNSVAYKTYAEMKALIPSVFDRPTPYTKRSLMYEKATAAQLESVVRFKTPYGRAPGYMIPYSEGGARRVKAFEKPWRLGAMVPARGVVDAYGNVSRGLINKLESVAGTATKHAGHTANASSESMIRNPRSYFLLTRPHGGLPPGIYERYIKGTKVVGKSKRQLNRDIRSGARRAGLYEISRTGRVVVATGIRPILLRGRQGWGITPRIPLHDAAARIYAERFQKVFDNVLKKELASV